jgi:hypothetical protein
MGQLLTKSMLHHLLVIAANLVDVGWKTLAQDSEL